MKSRRNNIFAYVVIAVAAAVVIYALFGRSTSVETASVILPTPVAEGDGESSGGDIDNNPVLAEVTPKTVQAVMAYLSRAESYSRNVTVEEFWNGGSSSTSLAVWVDGGKQRIRSDAGGDVKNILLDGGQLFIWYDSSEDVYTALASGGSAEADAWLSSLTYEDVLALPASAITGAGYETYAGDRCVYAEYSSESFGYRSLVYVSVNTGLLMGAETYDGETLVYRMTSGTPDLSVPDSRVFLAPGSDGGS